MEEERGLFVKPLPHKGRVRSRDVNVSKDIYDCVIEIK